MSDDLKSDGYKMSSAHAQRLLQCITSPGTYCKITLELKNMGKCSFVYFIAKRPNHMYKAVFLLNIYQITSQFIGKLVSILF